MSRNRRNRGVTGSGSLEPFGADETPFASSDIQGMSTTELASAGYNSQVEFAPVGSGKVTAKPLDIDKIYPDPSQPRRTVPSTLRQYWQGQPDADSMRFLFKKWLTEIELERGNRSFDLDAVLRGEDSDRARLSDDSESQTGEKEAALLKIADLATSIRRDGLTNPITVAPRNGVFVIETGERRWMAYQLLRWHFNGDTIWFKIPAREVDHINIWRQASENNARDDLSGIARARQLALLLMDIYGSAYEFAAFENFKDQEQAFYAQVASGEDFKVPTEKREMVLNAMGFRHPVQIRQYRALLRLPAEVWTLADDHNWTENAIQKDLLQKSTNADEMIQLARVKAGLLDGERVSALTREPADETAVPEIPVTTGSGKSVKFSRWRKDLSRLRKELDEMLIQERDEILREMEDILLLFRLDK